MSTESNTPVDPRIQVELEKLNTATDNINKYELELDEAKTEFKRLLAESVVRIKHSAHKLSNSIEAAKPYYESRIYAAQLTKETQIAAANHDKAKSIHAAAKEMVYLAEQGLGEKSTLDTACQEMLSHAASRVNQSQLEVTDAMNSWKMCQLKLEVANNRVGKLQVQLKQAIKASRPYYETRANYNGLLKTQKEKISRLEEKVAEIKTAYNDALKNLEKISEEIHRKRHEQRSEHNNHMVTSEEVQPFSVQNKNQQSVGFDVGEVQLNDKQHSKPNCAQQSCDLDKEDDCPHLQDFDRILTFPQKMASGMHKSASTSATGGQLFSEAQLRGPYNFTTLSDSRASTGAVVNADDHDIEQWTEIRLSHSDSTSSSYSNQSLLQNQTEEHDDGHSQNSSSSDEPKRKVTCTTIFNEEQLNKKHSLSQWLTRSNSFKSVSRRQSLDLLVDASDKVKDAFNYGFQKVGRSLERRNSETEMSNDCTNGGANKVTMAAASSSSIGGDFFLFSRLSEPKELLTDEQIANLLLNHRVDENGSIIVEELKSPLHQETAKQVQMSPNAGTGGSGCERTIVLL